MLLNRKNVPLILIFGFAVFNARVTKATACIILIDYYEQSFSRKKYPIFGVLGF